MSLVSADEMNSNDLRQKFLRFFEGKGHKVLPSASLVPSETDPSVLFTTAGMQQFKRYYSEPAEAPSPRIATTQKCIRTGDIDEVGDNTHLTFFEMLGNFTFGYPEKQDSYFKEETIQLAWEFLTQELGVDKSRIHATYFRGEKGVSEDTESLKILQSIDGLGKVESQGFDDNFWSLGTENSPGGPTVEFYIDGIEIWNLVFNEYILRNNAYEPAKFKGVDTGMGLERLICVLNQVESIYQTDLFDLPHQRLHILLKKEDPLAERIILDHIKAALFIIGDGVLPSNKDRGYVLRRLIRRAVVKGLQLGIEQNFLSDIALTIIRSYDKVYFESKKIHEFRDDGVEAIKEELDEKSKNILVQIEQEETKFRQTLIAGLGRLNSLREIDGKTAFDLYQSFGLPIEVTLEEAKRQNIPISEGAIEQFGSLLKGHQELSRTAAAGMFKGGLADTGEETKKLHTAAHLMLAALRQVLGNEVLQKGSNITAERLRFDFSYPEKMTDEQIRKVEDLVNEQIKLDLPVSVAEMSVDEAKQRGAMGVFESKYGEKVKVYSIGKNISLTPDGRSEPPFSREICGGPHASATSELGHFKIVKEESSSAGIRRIKAVLE